jgi:S-formylglutathione hydrolase FrmB
VGTVPASISAAILASDGIIEHTVACEFQSGETHIRVLLPDPLRQGQRYPVLYLLPVEQDGQTRYGDALHEARRLGLQQRYGGVVCVCPSFSQWPWYGDHPSRADGRQESYLMEVVVPFIDATYPVEAKAAGRFLLGFSKSGLGALALLLRHPDVFGRSAAWDAPVLPAAESGDPVCSAPRADPGSGAASVGALLRRQAEALRSDPPRLVISGYCWFQSEVERTHDLLLRLGIPHLYRSVKSGQHRWDGGWLSVTADLLICPAPQVTLAG